MMAGNAKCKIEVRQPGASALHARSPHAMSKGPVPSIRLIAIDIDGTLLDRAGNIPAENRQAIAAALDRGIEVALVTGRGFTFAFPVAERLALPVVVVASNGAIVRRLDGTTVLRRLMPRDVAHQVLAETAGYRGETAVVFDRPSAGQLVSGGLDWTHPSRAGYYGRYGALISEMVPLETCLIEDPIEVMFTGGVTRMRALIGQLEGARGAHRYAISYVEYGWRDFTLVDVLGAGVTKGTTLAEWVRELGLTRDAVMAVGDNYNDREMLAFAGTGVAMGNGVPELLDGTFHVTASNDEAGLAQAIERFALARATP
jgi:hydroxymethylpyrimidine pyrophosphatase-like HAD family hydrolase